MSFRGELVAIYTVPEHGGPPEARSEVGAVAGQGLEGDRYFGEREHGQVTLIELEALEAVRAEQELELGEGESRRNLVTRGVPLNHLVGARFTVGEVELEGTELCEPCGYLQKKTGKPLLRPLVHRGGLRARVLRGGPSTPATR